MKKFIIFFIALIASGFILNAQSIVIGAQDENWHTFSITSSNTYTLDYNFSEHNFDSDDGESDGWRQNYLIDWNTVDTIHYQFEIGNKFNPAFLLKMSSISFTSVNQTGTISTKIVDSDYNDNTGNVFVDFSNELPDFQGTPTTIGPQNSNWHSFNIVAGNSYRIDFDFSEHNFDSDDGESDGWRQNYLIDWNTVDTILYQFELGTKLNPEFLLSYSSITFFSNQTGELRVKIVDSDYGDNTGNVYVYFNLLTGINNVNTNNSFIIYPNPTSEKLIIKSIHNIYCSINIFNSLGQNVYTAKVVTDKKSINISGLQKGLYFVEIKDLKGNILLSEKIIKE